ncbi:MAG TPA: thioredoxin TrxC [Zoogloea sp.]|nr:thioredoxin TrxC [Zoogloea sp.]
MTDSMLIPCPHCSAINRIPADRLHDHGICGRCKKALFDGHPIELGMANFDMHAARSDLPLVVDFWAPWCGPCRSMAPAFSSAAAILEPEFRLGKLNTEEENQIASHYAIRSIPTLALFHQGKELARQSGAMGTDEIIRWVRHHAGR